MVILIVEDDALVGMALAALLFGAGHRVLGPAVDARNALLLAEADPPDLAFVDINIAGPVDGVSVARALTHQHRTTCIFVTAEPERARGLGDIAIGVVRKPFDLASLAAVVSVAAAFRSGRLLPPAPRHLELFA